MEEVFQQTSGRWKGNIGFLVGICFCLIEKMSAQDTQAGTATVMESDGD